MPLGRKVERALDDARGRLEEYEPGGSETWQEIVEDAMQELWNSLELTEPGA